MSQERLAALRLQEQQVQKSIADVYAQMTGHRSKIATAEANLKKAGNPRDPGHPARRAHADALAGYESACTEHSSYVQRSSALRNQIMELETQLFGSVGSGTRQARTAPAPDVNEVARMHQAQAAELNEQRLRGLGIYSEETPKEETEDPPKEEAPAQEAESSQEASNETESPQENEASTDAPESETKPKQQRGGRRS